MQGSVLELLSIRLEPNIFNKVVVSKWFMNVVDSSGIEMPDQNTSFRITYISLDAKML